MYHLSSNALNARQNTHNYSVINTINIQHVSPAFLVCKQRAKNKPKSELNYQLNIILSIEPPPSIGNYCYKYKFINLYTNFPLLLVSDPKVSLENRISI